MEQFVQWIDRNTAADAVFAGPMSTMATVKLCTGRPVVNHPHYEDAALRARTLQVYQLFSRRPARQVWRSLRVLGVQYAVVERVWCEGRSRVGCAMVDLWDVEDPENAGRPPLCSELFANPPRYFQRVFLNEALHVFRVRDDIDEE